MKQLFFAFFLLAGLVAHAQPTAWAFTFPISDANGVMDVATDGNGYVYVTGRFTGALELGATRLTGAGLCLFIAKCNANGRVLRVTKLGATTDVLPRSIVVDKAGNCYVTGNFLGTLRYNRGQQQITSASKEGGGAVFLLKCAPSGSVSWVRQADGGRNLDEQNSYCSGTGVAVDRAGNSYVTGAVTGANIRFGPLTFGPRLYQGFLASYSRQGRLRWARVFSALPGSFGTSPGGGVAVDNAGSCYLAGNTAGGWQLDGISLLNANGSNNYLARFEARQGRLLWALAVPGESNGGAIATDQLGDVCVGGSFSGKAAFGNITLTSAGEADGFVARYDPDGALDWATALGGPGYDGVSDLAIDQKSRQVFTTGLMNFTAQGTNQSFLARLNSDGRVEQQELVGGPGTSSGGTLAIDGKSNVYTAGVFTGSCRFGAIALSGAFTQSYFGRYGSGLKPHKDADVLSGPEISIFPNPAQSQFTLRLAGQEQAARATLYNQQGRAVANHALQPTASFTDVAFDTSALPDGLYLLRLESDQKATTRVVKVEH